MTPILHVTGCNGLAFTWTGPPISYETPLLSKHAVMPDGTRPEFGSSVRCGSCGRRLPLLELWALGRAGRRAPPTS